MVAAEDAAKPMGIPMSKAKTKRKTSSHSNSKKTIGRNSQTQTARKVAKLKPPTQSAVGRRPRTSSQQLGRVESKQTWIIAMLLSARLMSARKRSQRGSRSQT